MSTSAAKHVILEACSKSHVSLFRFDLFLVSINKRDKIFVPVYNFLCRKCRLQKKHSYKILIACNFKSSCK